MTARSGEIGPQHGMEVRAQGMGRFEAAIGLEIVLERTVDRAGDMAADRIDRLVFAAIAIRRARVDDQSIMRFQAAFDARPRRS